MTITRKPPARISNGTAATTGGVAGLVRSDLTSAGIRRQRCGRGFRYFAADGTRLTDTGALARVKALVIPPA
jgi:DNA topoisomerase IB